MSLKKHTSFTFEVLSEIYPKDERANNYSSEVKVLEEIVIEDLKLSKELKYG